MIDQNKAITIAKNVEGHEMDYDVQGGQNCGLKLYNIDMNNCWCVYVRRSDIPVTLLSGSTVIVIAKDSGEILYSGSAYDEG
jgi:hypothetical protein